MLISSKGFNNSLKEILYCELYIGKKLLRMFEQEFSIQSEVLIVEKEWMGDKWEMIDLLENNGRKLNALSSCSSQSVLLEE